MVVLSLGSNIGNRQENLRKAIIGLNSAGLEILKISSIYETEPVGFKDQDNFYNIILTTEYSKEPYKLLSEIHKIETELGRVREFKNSPRTIDIDIVTFNDQKIDNESLIIPHKEYMNRKFVLIPLAEIEPDFMFRDNRTVRETLDECKDNTLVKKLFRLDDEI